MGAAGRPGGTGDRCSTGCPRRSTCRPGGHATVASSGGRGERPDAVWRSPTAPTRPEVSAALRPVHIRPADIRRRDPRCRALDPPDPPHHRPRVPGRPAAAGRGPDAGRQLVELAAAQARRRRRCPTRPCSRRSTTTGSGDPRPGRSSASTGPTASPLGAPARRGLGGPRRRGRRRDRRLPPVRRDRRRRRLLPQCAGRRPADDGLLVRSGAGPRPVALVRARPPTRVCRWSAARAEVAVRPTSRRRQASGTGAQVGLQARLGTADARAAARRGRGRRPWHASAPSGSRSRCSRSLASSMAATMAVRPGTRCEARPCVGRVVPASQAAQQVGTFDGDPVGRPRESRRPPTGPTARTRSAAVASPRSRPGCAATTTGPRRPVPADGATRPAAAGRPVCGGGAACGSAANATS